jgi:hypothetical protein
MLCKTCLEQGEIACPTCGEPTPAGYGKQCQRCYWRSLLEKRLNMDSATFSVPKMAGLFNSFCHWLEQEVGEHKAALTIHRYLPFFTEIEREWRAVPEFGILLQHFGAKRLRSVLLPMRWMEATRLVVPNTMAKEDDSNRRRIAASLARFSEGSKERSTLDGYHGVLTQDLGKGKTTLRSIRLALTPAVALLLKTKEMGLVTPDQNALDAYLENRPGQRAAVSGFVRYLRDQLSIAIALPKPDNKRMQSKRKKALEAKLVTLMQENRNDTAFRKQWLSVALAYFHGLPVKTGLGILEKDIVKHDDGSHTVILNGLQYWIPKISGALA